MKIPITTPITLTSPWNILTNEFVKDTLFPLYDLDKRRFVRFTKYPINNKECKIIATIKKENTSTDKSLVCEDQFEDVVLMVYIRC